MMDVNTLGKFKNGREWLETLLQRLVHDTKKALWAYLTEGALIIDTSANFRGFFEHR